MVLQVFDMTAHGRLGQIDGTGGFRKATMFNNLAENMKPP
jgi:hypothetical protein